MIARLEVTHGSLTEYPLAEKVCGGWRNGVMFYPDAEVTKVTPLIVRNETPTDDDQDALAQIVCRALEHQDGGEECEVDFAAADAILAGGFRRPAAPKPNPVQGSENSAQNSDAELSVQAEPSDDYEAGYAEGFHHGRSTPVEPQTEPSGDERESSALCGDWPAPCNCDDPDTHDGSVPAWLVRQEEPQAEPTDAEVEAAAEEWMSFHGTYPKMHILDMMRAALRAAATVREGGEGRG